MSSHCCWFALSSSLAAPSVSLLFNFSPSPHSHNYPYSYTFCTPSSIPPLHFVSLSAQQQKSNWLASLSLAGISELWSQINFAVLLAEAGERWDTAAKGKVAGRQQKGHSKGEGREAAWRVGTWLQLEGRCAAPSVHHHAASQPPPRPAAKSSECSKGRCGQNAYVPAGAVQTSGFSLKRTSESIWNVGSDQYFSSTKHKLYLESAQWAIPLSMNTVSNSSFANVGIPRRCMEQCMLYPQSWSYHLAPEKPLKMPWLSCGQRNLM